MVTASSRSAEAKIWMLQNPISPQNSSQPHNLRNPTSVGRETCLASEQGRQRDGLRRATDLLIHG